jgi:lipoprotein-releasing system permease protein
VFVYSIGGPISDPPRILSSLREVQGVGVASPVLFQNAVVTTEENVTGTEVMVKGIEESRAQSSPMMGKVIGPGGRFASAEGDPGVAVGKHLASRLGVTKGSAISVTVPGGGDSVMPRSGSFVVTNVFSTGFYEFDARWLFVSLPEARQLTGQQGANLVEVKLTPGADIDRIVKDIEVRTRGRFAVSDWREMNRQLFSMLKIQQLVLFIVIGLIVFVSTFNIVSTLIMTVHEKRKEIGILASMGAEQGMVRRIFLWYGTLVGVAGTSAGLLLGVLACQVITRYELVSFPPEIAEVYFVSSIPFVTLPEDLAAIAAFAIAVSFFATIIPSLRAARLNPIDALRHE